MASVIPDITGEAWGTTPATSNVNMNGKAITGASTIDASGQISAGSLLANGNVKISSDDWGARVFTTNVGNLGIGTAGLSNSIQIGATGNVGVLTAPSDAALEVGGTLKSLNLNVGNTQAGASQGLINVTNTMNNNSGSYLQLQKSMNGGNSVNTNELGRVSYQGYASGGFRDSAIVLGYQSAAVSGTNVPSDLVFYTTSATNGLGERMRINSNGTTSIPAMPSVPLPNLQQFYHSGTFVAPGQGQAFSFNPFTTLPSTFGSSRACLIVKANDGNGIYTLSNPGTLTRTSVAQEYGKGFYATIFEKSGSTWTYQRGIGTIGHNPGSAGFALSIGLNGLISGGSGVSGSQFTINMEYIIVPDWLSNIFTAMNPMNIFPDGLVTIIGGLTLSGALAKGSGSFKIDHPLKPATHHLVHSFIEGPKADLMYRGTTALVGGKAVVNIDESAGMTEGTFVALCRDVICFVTNDSDWGCVRGRVDGNLLLIEAEDSTSSAKVNWLVIGERQDKHMYDTDWTDYEGHVIVEPLKDAK